MPRRAEFSKLTKRQAYQRCGGICEACCLVIQGTPEYDHKSPDFVSKDNSLENCQVLCYRCHRFKSAEDRPEIDRTRRLEEKRLGLRVKRRPAMAGSRKSRWKRKMDGTVERR